MIKWKIRLNQGWHLLWGSYTQNAETFDQSFSISTVAFLIIFACIKLVQFFFSTTESDHPIERITCNFCYLDLILLFFASLCVAGLSYFFFSSFCLSSHFVQLAFSDNRFSLFYAVWLFLFFHFALLVCSSDFDWISIEFSYA